MDGIKVSERSGNHRILESKTLFLFSQEDELEIKVETVEYSFILKIDFKKDESKGQFLEREIDETNRIITYHCVNFNDMSTGLISPIKVATLSGKAVFLALGSDVPFGSMRRVDYTLFMAE